MPVHEKFVSTLEEIGDLAVRKIGESYQFVSLADDTGSTPDAVRAFIYQVIREVQSEFRWPELIASVELEIPAAENEDTYQYNFPSDYLRPASNRDQGYLIENGYVFTNVSENFPFRYIRYSLDPSEWSGLLVKCIFFRLALEICMPVTENGNRYNALLNEYEAVVFPRAKMVASFDHENPKSRRARGGYSRTRSGGMLGAAVSAFNRVIGTIAPGHNHDTDYPALSDYTAHVAEFEAHEHDADYADLAVFNAHEHAALYAALVHVHVPNIEYAIKTDPFEHNPVAVPEWVNIPDLSVTITPAAAGSKIRISAVIYGTGSNAGAPILLRVTRDNTALELASLPGDRNECHGFINSPVDVDEMDCGTIDLLIDATAATETTFRIQLTMQQAAYNALINRCRTDTDTALYSRAVSTLTVEEVLQA